MRAFLESFVAETKGELFPTPEACTAFYSEPENFQKLQSGEIGDNLMYRYRAIASFHLWDEVCDAAMNATRALLEERGIDAKIADFDIFWKDFHTFIKLSHASGREQKAILSAARATLHYDFPAWLAQPEIEDPEAFRFASAQEFEFRLSAEGSRELESALAVWTTHIKALSKLVTRIKVDWQVRECVPLDAGAAREQRRGAADALRLAS